MVIIPTFADANYAQVTNIDGVDYILTFRWSAREAVWRMDMADLEATPLASNVPLYVGTSLLGPAHRSGAAVPPGLLVVYDTTSKGVPPGQAELGNGLRCVLCYFTLAELQAAS